MGIMNRIRNFLAVKASSVQPLIAILSSGHYVSPRRNLKEYAREGYQANGVVYRCVSIAARAVANVPIGVFVKGEQVENELTDLLKMPNPKQGYATWMEDVISYLMLTGNTYIENIGVNGKTKELWALRPDRMRIQPGMLGVAKYIYQCSGQDRVWEVDPVSQKSDILHMKFWNPNDDWYGQSPIEAAANSVDQHNLSGAWNQSLLQNSARPSGMMTTESRLDDAQYERLKQEMTQSYEGSKNSGRPMLLEQGLKWTSMQMSPAEMDWINGRNMSAREIASVYGLPSQMLGIQGDSTYSNYQEARQSFYEDTVLPLLDFVLYDINGWLRESYNGAELRKIVDDIPALAAKREKRWSMIQTADWMTFNEKRKATGFNEINNPDANVVWGNANAIPIGTASTPPEEGSETFPVDISMSKDKLAMIMDIISKVGSGELTEDVGRALALKVDPSFDVSLICEPEEEEEEEEDDETITEEENDMENETNPYGFCPKCGAPGKTRERRPDGNDTCENGCTYPSKDALKTNPSDLPAKAKKKS
jgi:HK97 family phage portal protein